MRNPLSCATLRTWRETGSINIKRLSHVRLLKVVDWHRHRSSNASAMFEAYPVELGILVAWVQHFDGHYGFDSGNAVSRVKQQAVMGPVGVTSIGRCRDGVGYVMENSI